MKLQSKFLGIIPARSGSKGIPGKNLIEVGGLPLIAHSIKGARAAKLVDKVVVATDDKNIAQVAKKYKAEVIMLPRRLTGDKSPVIGSVLYVLKTLEEKGEHYDAVALLEPTSPLRKRNDIDNAIKLLARSHAKADAVVSVGEVHPENPYIMKAIKGGRLKPFVAEKNIPRQLLSKAYFPYGVIYLCKTAALKKQKTFYPKRVLPYKIERWQNYEVDDIFDLICVRAMIQAMYRK